MIRRPPRSTQSRSSAASDVYKRQPGGGAGAGAGGLSWPGGVPGGVGGGYTCWPAASGGRLTCSSPPNTSASSRRRLKRRFFLPSSSLIAFPRVLKASYNNSIHGRGRFFLIALGVSPTFRPG